MKPKPKPKPKGEELPHRGYVANRASPAGVYNGP